MEFFTSLLVCVALIAALAIFSSGVERRQINREKEESEASRKDTYERYQNISNTAPHSISRNLFALGSAIYAQGKEQSRQDHKRATREIVTIVAVSLAASFALGSDWIFYQQYGTMKGQRALMNGQLNAMDEQAEISKAKISARFRLDGIQSGPVTNTDGSLAAISFMPVWENSGGTDAKDVKANWQLKVIPNTPAAQIKCAIPASSYVNQMGRTIASGSTVGLIYKTVPVTELNDIGTKNLILLSGHIEFRDIFPDDPVQKVDWCRLAFPMDKLYGRVDYLPLE